MQPSSIATRAIAVPAVETSKKQPRNTVDAVSQTSTPLSQRDIGVDIESVTLTSLCTFGGATPSFQWGALAGGRKTTVLQDNQKFPSGMTCGV
jgi:hypothetical protein